MTEEQPKKSPRDAEHCDYPDCEQHWLYVAERRRIALANLIDAVRNCNIEKAEWDTQMAAPLKEAYQAVKPYRRYETLTSRQHAAQNALRGCTCGSDGYLHTFNCRLRREGDDGKGAVKASNPHVHMWVQAPDSSLALCACGDYSDDWYCPKSPSHICSYAFGNHDSCDYCGLPEERK